MNTIRILFLIFFISFFCNAQAQTYEVGRMDFSFNDPARSNRTVNGEIHYPATSTGNNAAIAIGQFPLIVFGHGFATNINQYDGVYSEGLVREGYIIVYPETEGSFLFPSHANFAGDIAFLLDQYLQENTNSNSFFYEAFNGESASMGHSMGGGCSLVATAQNSNFTVHASVAPAETDVSAIDAALNISIPSLIIAGDEDCIVDSLETATMYHNLDSYYKTYIEIFGANHCNFGEAVSGSNCVTGELFSGCGNPLISKADQHTYTLNALKPWFDYWLKEDCGAWDTYQNYLTTATTHTYLQARTQPTVTAVSSNAATIEFPVLPGAMMYTVTAVEQSATTMMTETSNTNTVTISGLNPNTTYSFEVTTDCGIGNSPYTIDCGDVHTTCNMSLEFTTADGCAPIVNLNNAIGTGTYNAANQIVANGMVAAPDNVIFQAGICIDLGNEFEVQLGAEFLAEIMGCQ